MLVVFLLFGFSSSDALAQFFPAGSESKSIGLESSLNSRNGSAVLYNPANLSFSHPGHEIYLELGYLKAELAYEHPDFDQVKVDVMTPVANLGYAGAILDNTLHLGFIYFPWSRGKQSIDGVPRRIAGNYEALYIEQESDNYDLGIGASYSLLPELSLGVSVIRRSERKKLYATLTGDDVTLVKLDAYNQFYIPVFGVNYQYNTISTAISYRPAREKHYQGSQKSALSDTYTSPTIAGYEPTKIFLGLGIDYLKYSVSVHMNYYRWTQGKKVFQEGVTSQNAQSDLRDSIDRAIQFGYQVMPNLKVLAGYAYRPSPWGDGFFNGQSDQYRIGADFGGINNVTQKVMSIGSEYAMCNNLNLNPTIYRSIGRREIKASGDRPGYYQSEVLVFGLAAVGKF